MYYNDVVLVLRRNAIHVIDEMALKYREKTNEAICSEWSDRIKFSGEHDEDECWYWEDKKWYEDDPINLMVMEVLDNIEEEDYLFIRLGEDLCDIEVKGTYFDNTFNIRLMRKIQLPEGISK